MQSQKLTDATTQTSLHNNTNKTKFTTTDVPQCSQSLEAGQLATICSVQSCMATEIKYYDPYSLDQNLMLLF